MRADAARPRRSSLSATTFHVFSTCRAAARALRAGGGGTRARDSHQPGHGDVVSLLGHLPELQEAALQDRGPCLHAHGSRARACRSVKPDWAQIRLPLPSTPACMAAVFMCGLLLAKREIVGQGVDEPLCHAPQVVAAIQAQSPRRRWVRDLVNGQPPVARWRRRHPRNRTSAWDFDTQRPGANTKAARCPGPAVWRSPVQWAPEMGTTVVKVDFLAGSCSPRVSTRESLAARRGGDAATSALAGAPETLGLRGRGRKRVLQGAVAPRCRFYARGRPTGWRASQSTRWRTTRSA